MGRQQEGTREAGTDGTRRQRSRQYCLVFEAKPARKRDCQEHAAEGFDGRQQLQRREVWEMSP